MLSFMEIPPHMQGGGYVSNRNKQNIRCLSVDEILLYVVGPHNDYGLVFKEKGKGNWQVDSNGKTVVYNTHDNELGYYVHLDQDFFKVFRYIWYYGWPWDERRDSMLVGFRKNSGPSNNDGYTGTSGYSDITVAAHQDNKNESMHNRCNNNGSISDVYLGKSFYYRESNRMMFMPVISFGE